MYLQISYLMGTQVIESRNVTVKNFIIYWEKNYNVQVKFSTQKNQLFLKYTATEERDGYLIHEVPCVLERNKFSRRIRLAGLLYALMQVF
jgi:hypothetical protein